MLEMADHISDLNLLNDVICNRNGGKIIFATDDFFAAAENLIKAEEPEWREGVYTEFGKWMDGWETRRRRKSGHDFCIIQMAAPAVVYGVDVNTAFFTGNYAPAVSIQASETLDENMQDYHRDSIIGSTATDKQEEAANITKAWTTILEPVTLRPGYSESCHNVFRIKSNTPWQFLRFNLFPDGGVARLRIYGRVVPRNKCKEKTDLISIRNGGECVAYSDAHFGHPKNLIGIGNAVGMADGWETARRPDRPRVLLVLPNGLLNHSGYEWCILKLGQPGEIRQLIVDTTHFKGNSPDLVQIEASSENLHDYMNWEVLVPYSKVCADKQNVFNIITSSTFRYVKVIIQPDGGISRLRVIGYVTNSSI